MSDRREPTPHGLMHGLTWSLSPVPPFQFSARCPPQFPFTVPLAYLGLGLRGDDKQIKRCLPKGVEGFVAGEGIEPPSPPVRGRSTV